MSKRETVYARVEHLIDQVPGAATDDRILYLAYLKLFNQIDIPSEVFRQIAQRGDTPESVLRRGREVREARKKQAYQLEA